MTDSSRIVSAGSLIVSRLLILIVLAVLGPIAIASDEHAGDEPWVATHGKHDMKGTHEVAIFVGATDDRREWASTWGAEYGYFFMNDYSVGVFLDRAQGDLRSSVVGLAFWARVTKGLMLMFGPGVEYLDEAHGEDGDHGEEASKRHFLARIGVGYSFHVGKQFTILPVIHADFVDEHVVWVTGVNFGIRFGKKAH